MDVRKDRDTRVRSVPYFCWFVVGVVASGGVCVGFYSFGAVFLRVGPARNSKSPFCHLTGFLLLPKNTPPKIHDFL